MIPPPPLSPPTYPLFPYTTLFRSACENPAPKRYRHAARPAHCAETIPAPDCPMHLIVSMRQHYRRAIVRPHRDCDPDAPVSPQYWRSLRARPLNNWPLATDGAPHATAPAHQAGTLGPAIGRATGRESELKD